MTYQPHTWTKGETITAQLLQNMDNGVAAAIDALESAFGSNYTMGSKEYKVDFTDLGKDISANKITGTTLTATDAISGATLTTTGAISGATLMATATTGTGLTVSGETSLQNKLTVNGETNLQGALIVGIDNTAVDTTIKGKLIVSGKGDNNAREAADLTGKVNITGPLQVQGTNATTLSGTLSVDNNIYINSDFIHDIKVNSSGPENEFRAFFKTINLGTKVVDSEINSSTINLAGTRLNISNTTTNISSPTTEIEGNLIIGDDPTNNIYTHTVTIKANSTLNGVTTIKKLDQLIVGDSTTTKNNEIYGFTTISNLVVGALDVESGGTQTYSGIATFNTQQNFLHGNTTIDNLTTLKVLPANETHYIHGNLILGRKNANSELHSQTTEDDLTINSRNITIGLQSTNEYPTIVNNSNLTIYADTEIKNLKYLNVVGVLVNDNYTNDNFINGSSTTISGTTTTEQLIASSLTIKDRENEITLTADQLAQIKQFCNITDETTNGGETP